MRIRRLKVRSGIDVLSERRNGENHGFVCRQKVRRALQV